MRTNVLSSPAIARRPRVEPHPQAQDRPQHRAVVTRALLVLGGEGAHAPHGRRDRHRRRGHPRAARRAGRAAARAASRRAVPGRRASVASAAKPRSSSRSTARRSALPPFSQVKLGRHGRGKLGQLATAGTESASRATPACSRGQPCSGRRRRASVVGPAPCAGLPHRLRWTCARCVEVLHQIVPVEGGHEAPGRTTVREGAGDPRLPSPGGARSSTAGRNTVASRRARTSEGSRSTARAPALGNRSGSLAIRLRPREPPVARVPAEQLIRALSPDRHLHVWAGRTRRARTAPRAPDRRSAGRARRAPERCTHEVIAVEHELVVLGAEVARRRSCDPRSSVSPSRSRPRTS